MIRSMRLAASGLSPFAAEGAGAPVGLHVAFRRWRDRIRAAARRIRYRPEKRYMRGSRR